MKLVTFKNPQGDSRTGWLVGEGVVDMQLAHENLPTDMLTFIDNHEAYFPMIKSLGEVPPHYYLSEIQLLAPLPNPRSFRDYIGFEMHMQNASRSFGHKIGPAWYDMPIFYFTNHQAIYGPDDEIKRPTKETKMDIELELACIIGKKGKDIKAEEARPYIFGYTVFNDWTARAIQKVEMEIPLGPHKGKDYANAIGPCIVTADEMEQYRVPFDESVFVDPIRVPSVQIDRFNLKMTSRINGVTVCEGNYQTVYYTFEQMIERASENNVNLMPGDILGSGTVGWGSLIENNFTVHRPLEPGDVVELEIEGIGILRNTVC
ncbi:fumarylacetoacetate hydrolase family protein [Runella slithyformis]|uniref:Fumarylacetoacetate (FAA) hydrolase n=1 Tax=Runella slithyformis (strain ATCC 29530 / DSM 19594 / LMG 11500 / NCIMB 11436 / LSU 4) TaxID=761193 RepID=A0A7U3ZGR7_RUNSL|nr:fumarylacetoacetate hydrolase family protein [Runella slithyformis]AEI46920.1 fumarylacetoacetate (FAA) hydrolase [Runella slithyformis DSM 19594]